MSDDFFKGIIEFAIEREVEAAKFYHDLAEKVRFDSSKVLAQELENMELGHIEILKSYQKTGMANYKPERILDLQISDYMVDPALGSNATFQEIIIAAMKRETNANKIYLSIANQATDETTKNIFLKLAEEEAKHKLQLETLYDEEVLKEN